MNHEFVRSWIRWVSISLFVGAIIYKFKKILDISKTEIIYTDEEEDSSSPQEVAPVSPKSAKG